MSKQTIKLAGYSKEDVRVTVEYNNRGAPFIRVFAKNKEIGETSWDLSVYDHADFFDPKTLKAEMKNGLLKLTWEGPVEKQPWSVTVT